MPELARCQCRNIGPRDPEFACTSVATQEDLLCDNCRKPCMWGIAGQPHQASKLEFVSLTLR